MTNLSPLFVYGIEAGPEVPTPNPWSRCKPSAELLPLSP